VIIWDASKASVIYFTTDGSAPTVNSQRYTGPITISTTTTLKAMAVTPSAAQSPTAKGNYVVK
jgi:chitinase